MSGDDGFHVQPKSAADLGVAIAKAMGMTTDRMERLEIVFTADRGLVKATYGIPLDEQTDGVDRLFEEYELHAIPVPE